MASFRILDPFQSFLNLNGSAPASGGRFDFFEAGTTAPKAVYADPDLADSNGSSIQLDAAGRLTVDCWGSGAYHVIQYDADGSIISDADDIQAPGGSAQAIPPLEAGAFLSTDGAQLLWDFIRQLPDPTSSAGKFLKTDGVNFLYEAINIPAPAAPDIVITGDRDAGSLRIGISSVTTKVLFQWGSGQAPNTGQRQSAVDVAFPVAYNSAAIWADAAITSNSLTSNGLITAKSTPVFAPDKFSVHFDTQDFGNNASRFNQPIPFRWIAVGLVTVNP